MNFQLVMLPQVDHALTMCLDIFKSIVEKSKDELNVPFLVNECRTGRSYLFVNIDGGEKVTDALVIKFETRPTGLVGRIIGFGGTSEKNWDQYINKALEFCRQNGANKLVFEGRRGWEKVFSIKPIASLYEMEIV